jgi:hypothetical protein
MYKWLLALGVLALATVFTLSQRNAVKSAYVNGLVPYNKLPGRQFVFERDCYIFKLASRPTDYPLIAANATVPALPPEVDEKLIGTKPPGVRILDVVRTGTRFKIVSVRRDQSRMKTELTFEIYLLEENERTFPRLDAFFLLDHSPEEAGGAPRIREDYAVALVR